MNEITFITESRPHPNIIWKSHELVLPKGWKINCVQAKVESLAVSFGLPLPPLYLLHQKNDEKLIMKILLFLLSSLPLDTRGLVEKKKNGGLCCPVYLGSNFATC